MTLAAALSLSLGARAIYSGQIVHLRTQFMELSRQSAARQATLEELKEEVRERQQ
jgi:hypothetical protein